MKKRAPSMSFAEKHSPMIALGLALSLAGFCLAIDHYDLLPLQGEATPMYGTLKTPMLHMAAPKLSSGASSAASSAQKMTLAEKRRAARLALLKRVLQRHGSSSSAR